MTKPQAKAAPTPTYRRDYRPPDYLVDRVTLEFDLDPAATRVKARLACRANPKPGDGIGPLVLNAEGLELVALRLDGARLGVGASRQEDERVIVEVSRGAFVLDVETIIDPSSNTRLEGLYISNGIYCTQCEAEGFRRITAFPDRPDVMARYRTTIRASKEQPVLLSNGNRIAAGPLPDGRHFAVWDDPFPKPSYLFALVAGDLAVVEDRFVTASGREVALRIHVERGEESRTGYAMDALKRAMRWDEEVYGREYDLDVFNIVAVADFNMGAMENKSLNIFNAKYILADPETATDDDYAFIESIVAHEYFHNWTGNRVTCRDWFQLSLKEGLTVFRDQQFSADQRSAAVKRIDDVRTLRARQFPEDAGPLAHPVRPESYIEINNFYTATVYEKGAEVIRMLYNILGREGFRKGMDLYFRRHDGEAATCEDFVAAMADATGTDLERFKLWYAQAGTPEVTVEGRYEPARQAFELTLSQTIPPSQPKKKPMVIPLRLGLLGADGAPLPLDDGGLLEDVLVLDRARRRFRFHGITETPVISINRNFSAPIKLKMETDAAARALMLAADPDPFNRWEAGQQFATALLLDMIAAIAAGESPAVNQAFIAAFGKLIADEAADKALIAQAMMPPGVDYLADQMAVADIESIHRARETLRRALATALAEPLRAIYHANQSNRPYSPDAAAAGRRALKNAALYYLVASAGEEAGALAARQYATAGNMTDRVAAMRELTHMDDDLREPAFEDFLERFADRPLVLDKWFAMQALSTRADTLGRVEGLRAHRSFDARNPNKVRALIGTFANANPLRFHAADGSGYDFLADRVIELDPVNPQLAARLCQPLGRWRRFDSGRQDRMRAALERIAARPGLSRDVFEIARKSLDG